MWCFNSAFYRVSVIQILFIFVFSIGYDFDTASGIGDDIAPRIALIAQHNANTNATRSSRCRQGQFTCKCGRCLKKDAVCNGIRDCCDYNDDESVKTCSNFTCSKNKFRCNYGGCIDKTKVCDGHSDCVDESDETKLTCHYNSCGEDHFRCDNGTCIHKMLVCDGIADCKDLSDETLELCHNHSCSANKFRCKYGACIAKVNVCNGFKNCLDNSDEQSALCTQRNALDSCILPARSEDKEYTVHCPAAYRNCSKAPGRSVPSGASLDFICKKGYVQESSQTLVTTCTDSRWNPLIKSCNRQCEPLPKLEGITIECERSLKGNKVPCDEFLTIGAIVYMRCKREHHSTSQIDYPYITCLPNGQWSNPLLKCIPNCGSTFTAQDLIADGKPDVFGDSPWHVAVYSTTNSYEPMQICGGTIISSQLILSAAHCFYKENKEEAYEPYYFEVGVSKIKRDYTVKDKETTKFYKVHKIFYPGIEYTGSSTNYAGDIAVLKISGKLSFSFGVLPACVDWTANDRFNPGDGTAGKLSGWGFDKTGNPSDTLLAAALPYISYTKCIHMVNPDFRNSISVDKFCAGYAKGAGARPGDSGGGLMFKERNSGMYFIRGIVSNKDSVTGEDESSIATFTDVSVYISWIYKVRQEVENEALTSQGGYDLGWQNTRTKS